MKKRTIDIIGAGIGGLAMAIALRQKGFFSFLHINCLKTPF